MKSRCMSPHCQRLFLRPHRFRPLKYLLLHKLIERKTQSILLVLLTLVVCLFSFMFLLGSASFFINGCPGDSFSFFSRCSFLFVAIAFFTPLWHSSLLYCSIWLSKG